MAAEGGGGEEEELREAEAFGFGFAPGAEAFVELELGGGQGFGGVGLVVVRRCRPVRGLRLSAASSWGSFTVCGSERLVEAYRRSAL